MRRDTPVRISRDSHCAVQARGQVGRIVRQHGNPEYVTVRVPEVVFKDHVVNKKFIKPIR